MPVAQIINLPGNQIITGPLPAGRFPDLASVVTKALDLVFPIAGLALFLFLVWGGFEYLTSMGDPKKAEGAKGKITNAIIGFIIIFVAFWLVQILDYIFKLGVYAPQP